MTCDSRNPEQNRKFTVRTADCYLCLRSSGSLTTERRNERGGGAKTSNPLTAKATRRSDHRSEAETPEARCSQPVVSRSANVPDALDAESAKRMTHQSRHANRHGRPRVHRSNVATVTHVTRHANTPLWQGNVEGARTTRRRDDATRIEYHDAHDARRRRHVPSLYGSDDLTASCTATTNVDAVNCDGNQLLRTGCERLHPVKTRRNPAPQVPRPEHEENEYTTRGGCRCSLV